MSSLLATSNNANETARDYLLEGMLTRLEEVAIEESLAPDNVLTKLDFADVVEAFRATVNSQREGYSTSNIVSLSDVRTDLARLIEGRSGASKTKKGRADQVARGLFTIVAARLRGEDINIEEALEHGLLPVTSTRASQKTADVVSSAEQERLYILRNTYQVDDGDRFFAAVMPAFEAERAQHPELNKFLTEQSETAYFWTPQAFEQNLKSVMGKDFAPGSVIRALLDDVDTLPLTGFERSLFWLGLWAEALKYRDGAVPEQQLRKQLADGVVDKIYCVGRDAGVDQTDLDGQQRLIEALKNFESKRAVTKEKFVAPQNEDVDAHLLRVGEAARAILDLRDEVAFDAAVASTKRHIRNRGVRFEESFGTDEAVILVRAVRNVINTFTTDPQRYSTILLQLEHDALVVNSLSSAGEKIIEFVSTQRGLLHTTVTSWLKDNIIDIRHPLLELASALSLLLMTADQYDAVNLRPGLNDTELMAQKESAIQAINERVFHFAAALTQWLPSNQAALADVANVLAQTKRRHTKAVSANFELPKTFKPKGNVVVLHTEVALKSHTTFAERRRAERATKPSTSQASAHLYAYPTPQIQFSVRPRVATIIQFPFDYTVPPVFNTEAPLAQFAPKPKSPHTLNLLAGTGVVRYFR